MGRFSTSAIMALVALKCPHCGANVDIDDGRDSAFCSYCGTKVVNENVKTMKVDNSDQFRGALSGALNSLCANDLDVAKKLVDKALELDGECSDALYIKSALFLRDNYSKSKSYFELASKSDKTIGLVTGEKYDDILRSYINDLRKESNKYVKNVLANEDLEPKDLDNCRLYVEKNIFCKIDSEFPYLYELVATESEKEFSIIEQSIGMPNEITQEHWDALRTFDRKYLRTATTVFFANPQLKERYATLIKSYCDRLDNKWVGLFKKGPVKVDHKELHQMKSNVDVIRKWTKSFAGKSSFFTIH